jgi:DNA-binding CsgD family transcriptional regulator
MFERDLSSGATTAATTANLSRRELEVIAMTSRGLTNNEIAGNLDVTIHAVKFHLASIYRKLGVTNRTEAAVAYLQGAPPTARLSLFTDASADA